MIGKKGLIRSLKKERWWNGYTVKSNFLTFIGI
jgi:hypothetical protein